MDITTLAAAVAFVANANVPRLGAALATPPNTVEAIETPALILYPDSPNEPIQIRHQGPGEQEWSGRLYGQLLVAREGDTPQELSIVNDLLTPLVDAFAVHADGTTAVERYPDQFGYGVYQCLVTQLQTTQRIGYAGVDYTGAEIFWTYRFDRTTGSA